MPQADDSFRTKNRVSSAIMSYNSPVFKAMLSKRFKEGYELASTAAVEIPLPDDNPEMMQVLCKILHHRHDSVPQKLGAPDILALAELCDKYNCAVAVKPSVSDWAIGILEAASAASSDVESNNKRGCLLTAACLLQHGALVHRVAVDMVLNTNSPVVKLATMGPGVWPNLAGKLMLSRLHISLSSSCSITNSRAKAWSRVKDSRCIERSRHTLKRVSMSWLRQRCTIRVAHAQSAVRESSVS